MTEVSGPVAQANVQAFRVRLLWLLLLVLPVLPIVQLTQVWRQVGHGSAATYVATLHATVMVSWLVLALIVGGMLRRRPRAVEWRVRAILAVIGVLISVVTGIVVAWALGALLHAPPRWDAGGSVAVFGASLSMVVRFGWPRAGLAWSQSPAAGQISVRPTVLVPGILLAASGAALAHLGDVALRYDNGRALIAKTPDLPLAYGLLTTAGWVVICLAIRHRRTQVIGFGLAAAAVAWVGTITNSLNGDGLIFTWYGLLPAALGVTALVRLRRYRRAQATRSQVTAQTG